jgi:hypothetical protein
VERRCKERSEREIILETAPGSLDRRNHRCRFCFGDAMVRVERQEASNRIISLRELDEELGPLMWRNGGGLSGAMGFAPLSGVLL